MEFLFAGTIAAFYLHLSAYSCLDFISFSFSSDFFRFILSQN
jgi:hypothetical protein